MCEIFGDAFHQEINITGERPALAHLRPSRDFRLKSSEIALGLRGQMHEGKTHHGISQGIGIEDSPEALHKPGISQRTHPAQTRWGRQTNTARQFDIAQPAISLQFTQDYPVERIE